MFRGGGGEGFGMVPFKEDLAYEGNLGLVYCEWNVGSNLIRLYGLLMSKNLLESQK